MFLILIFCGLSLIFSFLALLGAAKLLGTQKRATIGRLDDASFGNPPSVTVCIPARNETHAMTACLESVLASDYEKLEIIVLDDSSNDDTSVLIKSFAHAGVRFLEGSPLPAGWLGKNHALDGLLEEASGSYVVFMDVDTTIKPDTISNLLRHMEKRRLTMCSVIPKRLDGMRASVLFGCLRYFWALLLSSERSPAASSALWCINRHELQNNGGIAAVKNVVQPEMTIAHLLARRHQFQTILSNKLFDVSFEKKWSSQAETSIRLLSPLTGGGLRSIVWLIVSLLLLTALLTLPIGLILHNQMLLISGSLLTGSLVLLFSIYFSIAWRSLWWLGGLVLWPLLLVQEVTLLLISMIQYARGRVSWKGRLITRAQ